MDTGEPTSAQRPQRQPGAMGGTVEPANRAPIAKSIFQTPIETAAERYELRDPFAEVTYRSHDFAEIAAKADKLSSKRFVAIDADGHRITITRVGDQWQRGEMRPLRAKPARDLSHERDDESPPASPARRDRAAPDRPPSATEAIARIDARSEHTARIDRKSTRLNSSHHSISYAVFCLKKKK